MFINIFLIVYIAESLYIELPLYSFLEILDVNILWLLSSDLLQSVLEFFQQLYLVGSSQWEVTYADAQR